MVNLSDIRTSLEMQVEKTRDLPTHVGAFKAWLKGDDHELRKCVDVALGIPVQARHTEHVAALGFGAHGGLLKPDETQIMSDEIELLSGRTFFAKGRTPRFEIDGIALLGVAVGVTNKSDDKQNKWLLDLLKNSEDQLVNDPWQLGLVRAAQQFLGESNLRILPPELTVALWSKGVSTEPGDEELKIGWEIVIDPSHSNLGPAHDIVRLVAFDQILSRLGQVAISKNTREELVTLLENISRSMRLWRFEATKRTPKSDVAKWNIDNEYHVQSLLWAILAPIFSDLEDEENLPSIGHKKPRADLCVPSLRTIIEVKFKRGSGQSACAKVTDEIAADASLYLSQSKDYDNIVAFVWDDSAQTEEHHELKAGLESINGISAAVVIPRPSKMKRN